MYEFKIDDVVQITNPKDKWFPSLIVLTEVKESRLMGYCYMPKNDGEGGAAYRFFKPEDIELIGSAIVIERRHR